MLNIIITNPNYDDTTNYLLEYTKEILTFAESHGIDVTQLKRPRLTNKHLASFIKKKNPNFMFFNGHGDEDTIFGDKIKNKVQALVQKGKNHALLENRFSYAFSCWAARSLGRECTKKGGCFIGYNLPFTFWIDEQRSANPAKDKVARLFLEPSNMLVKSVLKGNSASESVSKFREHSLNNIQSLLKNKKEPGAIQSIKLLWSNMQCIEVLGDMRRCINN